MRSCQNCGYPQKELRSFSFWSRHEKYDEVLLCELCAQTHLGHALSDSGDPKLYMSLAYIANLLLDRINQLEQKIDDVHQTLGLTDSDK